MNSSDRRSDSSSRDDESQQKCSDRYRQRSGSTNAIVRNVNEMSDSSNSRSMDADSSRNYKQTLSRGDQESGEHESSPGGHGRPVGAEAEKEGPTQTYKEWKEMKARQMTSHGSK